MKDKEWKIENGDLWVKRGEAWVIQRCPYSSKYCGEECPLLIIDAGCVTLCNHSYYGELF